MGHQQMKDNKMVMFTVICAMVSAAWILFTYQQKAKPILILASMDGKVVGFNQGLQHIQFTLNFSKQGESLSANTKIYSTFLDFEPNLPGWKSIGIDKTVSDYPDMPNGKNETFVIDKFIPIDYFVRASNFPGSLLFAINCRWSADNLVFLKRTFSFTVLYRLLPAMADENGSKIMVFQVRAIKGPRYKEEWFASDNDTDFFNRQMAQLLVGEDINSMWGIDNYMKTKVNH